MVGDQQGALVGQACLRAGMSKSTYGTGCFAMVNTGPEVVRSSQQLLATVAYRHKGQTTYALEGSIFVAGVAVQWIRDKLGLIETAAETSQAYEATGGDTGGVYLVPAFTGLGAPYWQPDVRGMITGLTLDTNRNQLVTACLQAVAYQTHDLVQCMGRDGAHLNTLRVDGGMVVNDHMCQFLADLLDVVVERPTNVETTALGAAMLAAVGVGLYDDLHIIGDTWALERRFTPGMDADHRQHLLAGYERAVRQVLA